MGMKKLLALAASSIVLLFCACTTNVVVDSTADPMATYDEIGGTFSGKLAGNINQVFKSTNLALEKDLHYFRVGQIPGNDSWRVYARAELDIQIIVALKQLPNDQVSVEISYGDGNLMKSQQIFNTIAKNLRYYTSRR